MPTVFATLLSAFHDSLKHLEVLNALHVATLTDKALLGFPSGHGTEHIGILTPMKDAAMLGMNVFDWFTHCQVLGVDSVGQIVADLHIQTLRQ